MHTASSSENHGNHSTHWAPTNKTFAFLTSSFVLLHPSFEGDYPPRCTKWTSLIYYTSNLIFSNHSFLKIIWLCPWKWPVDSRKMNRFLPRKGQGQTFYTNLLLYETCRCVQTREDCISRKDSAIPPFVNAERSSVTGYWPFYRLPGSVCLC